MSEAAIVFDRVSVTLGGVSILDSITAEVPAGSSTAVVGPNGAGKTTLLLALLGQVAYEGRITLRGAGDDGRRAPRIGYVPQRLTFDRGMPATVTECLAMGLQRRPLWAGVAAGVRARATDLLQAVHADALRDRALGALSGGELQRVLLALALAHDPELLVLDEPAAGVDPRGEELFCELLESLRHAHGFTQLMVSHDLPTVTHHATHVICMNRTLVTQGPPREVLTREALAAVFGLHGGLPAEDAMADGVVTCTEHHHGH